MIETATILEPDGDDLRRLDREALAAALVDAEKDARRAQARYAAALAEINSRGVQITYGYGSLDALQVDLVHISRGEAKKRAARTTQLHPRPQGTSVLPALAPHTQAALAAGTIGLAHVDEILNAVAEIPAMEPAEVREGAEKALVALAEQTDPHTVRKAGAHTVALFNPDGTEPTGDDPAHPYRELHLGKRRDGRYGMTGILDPETGVLLETLLSPLAKPQPAENGERDPRTAPERRGDALAELLQRTHAAADVPFEAGHRPTVMVSMHLADVTDLTTRDAARGGGRAAGAKLNDLPISVEAARRYACDAQIIPTVLGTHGEVLDLGRSERLATPAQRRALTLRDKGCIKCGRPPQWCQAHHLIHWLDDGRTDLDNLCLLCTECRVSRMRLRGWDVEAKVS